MHETGHLALLECCHQVEREHAVHDRDLPGQVDPATVDPLEVGLDGVAQVDRLPGHLPGGRVLERMALDL